jgi:hypothetical protein
VPEHVQNFWRFSKYRSFGTLTGINLVSFSQLRMALAYSGARRSKLGMVFISVGPRVLRVRPGRPRRFGDFALRAAVRVIHGQNIQRKILTKSIWHQNGSQSPYPTGDWEAARQTGAPSSSPIHPSCRLFTLSRSINIVAHAPQANVSGSLGNMHLCMGVCDITLAPPPVRVSTIMNLTHYSFSFSSYRIATGSRALSPFRAEVR